MLYRFGDFELDVADRRLTRGGAPVELGDRAFDLLAVLAASPGRLLSKDVLMDAVWPNLFVTENNLQVQVSGLRKLLGEGMIATVSSRGYRFTPAVEAREEGAADPPAAAVQPQGLVGREADLASLRAALAAGGLVTLWGPGGIGKTRLAQAVFDAAVQAGAPAAWADLTRITEPDLLVALVAEACGAPSAEDARSVLIAHLRGARALVVLDNAEHLLDEVADLAGALAAEAPGVSVLVTSQAILRAPGEQAQRLEGLRQPDPEADLASVRDAPAVNLFVQRARALDRRFELTADNRDAVVAICRRLDGIPLALELAASRLGLFGAVDLERRLERRFDVLAQGYRGAPSRQQTMQAVFDWSYGLLPEAERIVFRRLAVFSGPFSLEQACDAARGQEFAEWDVIEAVGRLVDRSLVDTLGAEVVALRLTETARAFGLDRLAEARDLAALARGRDLQAAAGRAARSRSADVEAVVQFSAALELQRRLEALGAPGAGRLPLLLALGPSVQTALSPANPRCAAIYGEALALAREGGDAREVFHALWGYWHYLSMAGRVRDAATYADELAALAPRLGEDGLELEAWHAGFTTHQLRGDVTAVLEASERAMQIYHPERHVHLAEEFGGHDAGVCAVGQRSVALWLAGRIREALSAADGAMARVESLDHAYSRAVGLFYAAMTYQGCGRTDAFARASAALLAESDRFGLEILGDEARLLSGRAAFEAGADPQANLAAMREAFDRIVGTGDYGFAMHYAALVADAELALRDLEPAGVRLQMALGYADEGQGFFLPELHRLLGRCALGRGDRTAAVAATSQAVLAAQAQGAATLQLRALADLAEAGVDTAVGPLCSLLAAFASEVETPDLARARAAVPR